MHKYIIFFIFSSIVNFSFSQEKIDWSYHYDNSNDELIIGAVIEEGWYLYSQIINEGIGPVPTSFTFNENAAIEIVGKVIEPEPIKKYDENFEQELSFFKNEVAFKQKMKVSKSTSVIGVVTYMLCNETMCLPPKDVEFVVSINK